MISWTRLLTGQTPGNDDLRYAKNNGDAPKVVVWNATGLCNLSCRHCYFEARGIAQPNQLSTQEAKAFIQDLAQIRVPVLLFSGGEPLLRKDIFELAQFAKDNKIKPVLSTNGTLITQKSAQKIKEAGFSYVGVSIDGKEKTHDKFRQNKGAFQKALTGLRNCQNAGLKVGLRFTLTQYNFRDLADIFGLVEEESIPRLCIYHLVYSGRGSSLIKRDLTDKGRIKALELIWQKTRDFYQRGIKTEVLTVDNHSDGVWIYLRLKRYNPKYAQRALELLKIQGGNSSGVNLACVDDCGNIYADQFLRTHILGNIRQERFSGVWQDPLHPILSLLRKRHLFLKGRCARCRFLALCNGNFRSRAYAIYGDLWQSDPACYLTDGEISRSWN